jgi:uncharacterized protein
MVDPQLADEIARIKAIDNHAHPVRPVASGEAPDKDYDALPVESLEPESDPVFLRPNAPAFVSAHQALFNGDKTAAARQYGQDYAVQILDRLGIDKMVANRVSMGPGLPPSRFLWAGYVDALMYPLPAGALIHNSDQKTFFALEEDLLKRYYAESGVASRPATLEDYLNKVVRATLERHRAGGAIAEKFEMAYLRTFEVGNPARADAERAWSSSGENPVQYKALQDYLFRFIVQECGRLGMAVHLHTGAGAGGYYSVATANPMLLEPLLNDPALRKTNFVMLHGGWPYQHQITALLTKPNAYLDFSAQNLFLPPGELAQTIRAWLEWVPEKVLFGTDAYPFAAEAGWEETGYVATEASRRALGIALTGMMRDGEITRERAVELANMVLRDNARKLYSLK